MLDFDLFADAYDENNKGVKEGGVAGMGSENHHPSTLPKNGISVEISMGGFSQGRQGQTNPEF